MKTVMVRTSDQQLTGMVQETQDQVTWRLDWSGIVEGQNTQRMLRAAETIVLKNGGERIEFTCGSDQEAMRAALCKWQGAVVTRQGNQYMLELMAPRADGMIHEDNDFRTPLHRITCPTCVESIAGSRTRQRQEAFGKGKGPKAIARHSRRIAQAYDRLAEIEKALEIPRAYREMSSSTVRPLTQEGHTGKNGAAPTPSTQSQEPQEEPMTTPAPADWTMDALRGVRDHARMAEERKGQQSGVPGWNQDAPQGHSFWDGEQWYPVPQVTPLQVLRALLKDPSQENLETAAWYTQNWNFPKGQ